MDRPGSITDRSQELLGRTDSPCFLRRQLEEQIARVEQGLDPMNVFLEDTGGMLHGNGPVAGDNLGVARLGAQEPAGPAPSFRQMFHKGFGLDDADRYGPAFELVKELHRRIEEAEIAARGSAQPTQPTPAAVVDA